MTNRIIPCLDIDNGKVVKGVNFKNLKDIGDPVEIAEFYNKEGADELVLLDINARCENRKNTISIVEKIAKNVSIPIIVGGGIKTLEDIENILNAGASKVSISSAAVNDPNLIEKASDKFGSKFIIIAIDGKKRKSGDGWNVYTSGGRVDTGIDVLDWAIKAENLGAGEILLTSMDADGTKDGYDIKMTKSVCDKVNIPVIASGGCGKIKDFSEVFKYAGADAALAASIFHYKELSVKDVKNYLNLIDKIKFDNGLVPAIIQEYKTGEVLMLAYMNKESLGKTIETGKTWFWSRSRNKLWNKGETSGHFQNVKNISVDCDFDTLLIKVNQIGAACHTGNKTCFYRNFNLCNDKE